MELRWNNIVRRWRVAMRRPTGRSQAELDRREREADRRIVCQFADGDYRLKRGEFVTRAELAREVEGAIALDFAED